MIKTMTVRRYFCDLCGKEGSIEEEIDIKRVTTTAMENQFDKSGRRVDMSYSVVEVDLCLECMRKVVVLEYDSCLAGDMPQRMRLRMD